MRYKTAEVQDEEEGGTFEFIIILFFFPIWIISTFNYLY